MPRNTLDFSVWGRYAMFTDPLTRVGGEKCSYHLPSYEALKGICKSIYWKPTLIWYVDSVRLMRRIRTQTRGMKPLDYVSGGNTLAIYTYLTGDARSETPADLTDGPGVEYQVRAHFEWNPHHPALAADRVEGKHFSIAQRSLERGGRQDIFLGTRDCQGYVAPCRFGEGTSDYDKDGALDYALMFHSFDYPDETGAGPVWERTSGVRTWTTVFYASPVRMTRAARVAAQGHPRHDAQTLRHGRRTRPRAGGCPGV